MTRLHGYRDAHPPHCSYGLILKLLPPTGRPLCVRPFRHGHGFVAQHLAHLFQRNSGQEHFHRKGIAQHVRVKSHRGTSLISECQIVIETLHLLEPLGDVDVRVAGPRPKEIVRVLMFALGKGMQSIDHVIRNNTLQSAGTWLPVLLFLYHSREPVALES